VHEALLHIARDHTVIVIAHRLSTVRGADRIVVIEAGRIAESGRHDDLLAARGRYWRLVKHQMLVA
jgi:ATP-binding cassette subfamily B protein